MVFIAIFGAIFTIISLVLAGTEETYTSNSVTVEISLTVLFYLGYQATSVWYVWKYTPYANLYYEWNKYETEEELIQKEAEVRGYKYLNDNVSEDFSDL